MLARLRRGSATPEATADEGPFVSFTDLVIGILFLFLILVAALMLMHQEAQARQRAEILRLQEIIRELQAKLDAMPKVDNRPAFRLGIVFNIYQRPSGSTEPWTFSRTVQVFRSSDDYCINNVVLRSNLSTAWRPPTSEEDIPTVADAKVLGTSAPCGLSGSGDHWDTASETGNLRRVSPSLYSGTAVLHRQTGDFKLDIQYRVLGVYDDYFRR